MDNYHISVLLPEVIDLLNITRGGKYIDATLGGGGHAIELVKKGARVLGIDADREAISFVESRIKHEELRIQQDDFVLVRGNFRDIKTIATENGFKQVDGIVFDLGVSGHQLDTEERGFSLQKDAKLDMRMDQNLPVTAKDLVNGLTKNELSELFTKFGEEPFAKQIARNIVIARSEKPIVTTKELAQIVERSVRRRSQAIHPATKIFQALRIAVNDELHSVEDALPGAIELLHKHGRLIVISFHSLEDRIIKRAFQAFAAQGKGVIITEKPIVPSSQEQEQNRRSRSAKLRVFEKL